MEARNFVKLYHYKEYLGEIENIINSTSLEIRESDKDIIIPRIKRMKNKTYYIRNTQPQLAKSVKIIADSLTDAYSSPSFLNECNITTIYIITSRFLDILKWARGEERKNKLKELKLQVEEQKPPAQLTFTNLINSTLNI